MAYSYTFGEFHIHLNEFMFRFESCYELESTKRTVRFSNGEGELTEYETVTFCKRCHFEIGIDGCENPDCDYCVLEKEKEDDDEED